MRKKIAAASMLLLALTVTAIPFQSMAAVRSYETDVTNNIRVGDINISLSEYEVDENGKEVPYEDDKAVVPGEVVSDIVRVKNLANTAWIRLQIDCVFPDKTIDMEDGMITPDTDQWIKCGDYWYYKEPLETDETADFIQSITVPHVWGTKYSGQSFTVDIQADAVQTANFTPDFHSDDPWFGTLIEACAHSSHQKQTASNQSFAVTFEDGAQGLVKTGDDFFANWNELMPGDSVSDKVQIKNSYRKSVKIYFRAETVADDPLSGNVKLEIKNGDQTIYDGPMNGSVKDGVLLAELNTNDTRNLSYTVSIPSELTNRYALSETKTKWIFRAELYQSSGGGGGGSHGGGSSSKDSGNGPGAQKPNSAPEPTAPDVTDRNTPSPLPIPKFIKKYVPKLGDDNIATIAFCTMSASGFLLLYMLTGRKRRKEKKD